MAITAMAVFSIEHSREHGFSGRLQTKCGLSHERLRTAADTNSLRG